jgi:hypothetical protein
MLTVSAPGGVPEEQPVIVFHNLTENLGFQLEFGNLSADGVVALNYSGRYCSFDVDSLGRFYIVSSLNVALFVIHKEKEYHFVLLNIMGSKCCPSEDIDQDDTGGRLSCFEYYSISQKGLIDGHSDYEKFYVRLIVVNSDLCGWCNCERERIRAAIGESQEAKGHLARREITAICGEAEGCTMCVAALEDEATRLKKSGSYRKASETYAEIAKKYALARSNLERAREMLNDIREDDKNCIDKILEYKEAERKAMAQSGKFIPFLMEYGMWFVSLLKRLFCCNF